MSFRNDSPSKFMHFCPRTVTPNQFKLIQGGDPEHLKSSQGLASLPPITHVHSHHHHQWKSWFLEKLFSDCRTPVAFVSRYLVIERLILFLSKYKKTREPTTVNVSQSIKSGTGVEVPCYELNFPITYPKSPIFTPTTTTTGKIGSWRNYLVIAELRQHLCPDIQSLKDLFYFCQNTRKLGSLQL